jgi:hypothetical protein
LISESRRVTNPAGASWLIIKQGSSQWPRGGRFGGCESSSITGHVLLCLGALFLSGFHGMQLFRIVDVVDEQDAIAVIDLVLKDPG